MDAGELIEYMAEVEGETDTVVEKDIKIIESR